MMSLATRYRGHYKKKNKIESMRRHHTAVADVQCLVGDI